MSGKDAWFAKSEFDVKLPSGTLATLALPNMQDLILSGNFRLESLAEIGQQIGTDPAQAVQQVQGIDPEQLAQFRDYSRTLVAETVRAIDGEPVRLSLEDVTKIPEEDRELIYRIANRALDPERDAELEGTVPKAAFTSPSSNGSSPVLSRTSTETFPNGSVLTPAPSSTTT